MLGYEDVLTLVVAAWVHRDPLLLTPNLDAIHKRSDANAVMRPSHGCRIAIGLELHQRPFIDERTDLAASRERMLLQP